MIVFTLLRRELGQVLRSGYGVFALCLSLMGGTLLWLHLLAKAEGTSETLPALWSFSAALSLPFLAAVASAQGFTQDRENGMMRLMFSTPIRARSWVLGKVFSAWGLCLLYLCGMLLANVVLLRWLLPPSAQVLMTVSSFLLGGLALLAQAFLWCSISTWVSLFSRRCTTIFFLSLFGCYLLPYLMAMLLPKYEATRWSFPFQQMAYDCANGLVDVRLMVGCITVSAVLIYASGLIFDALRLCATER